MSVCRRRTRNSAILPIAPMGEGFAPRVAVAAPVVDARSPPPRRDVNRPPCRQEAESRGARYRARRRCRTRAQSAQADAQALLRSLLVRWEDDVSELRATARRTDRHRQRPCSGGLSGGYAPHLNLAGSVDRWICGSRLSDASRRGTEWVQDVDVGSPARIAHASLSSQGPLVAWAAGAGRRILLAPAEGSKGTGEWVSRRRLSAYWHGAEMDAGSAPRLGP